MATRSSLSLGIPGVGGVDPGTHFCALYSGPAERDRLLFPFLEEGLRHGDKCLCLIDDVEPALVRDLAVGQPGREYSQRSAQLDVERASDTYLRSGEFSIAEMMSFLFESADAAIADDFDLLRAAGEMGKECDPHDQAPMHVGAFERPLASTLRSVLSTWRKPTGRMEATCAACA